MTVFRFKRFTVDDSHCGMKVSSDSVLLAAWALAVLSEVQCCRHTLNVVDVGAGSGVLSLLVASEVNGARVVALEIDSSACADADTNFSASEWNGRLSVVEGDFRDYVPVNKIDFLISNPPYFATGEHAREQGRAVARHEYGSLTYVNLLRYAAGNLATDGYMAFISPADRYDEIIFEAEMCRLKLRGICRVQTSVRKPATRILWLFSLTDGSIDKRTLAVRDVDGGYTPEYIGLVEKYYFKI